MTDDLSRRRFLKISAATFGAGAVGTQFTGCGFFGGGEPATGNVEKITTYCEMCGWFCGAIGHVRDGKLWKLEGNPIDPGCRGRLCPRGTAGVGAHYDPDRLQAPLIRVGERGEQKWKVATWDEALDYVADKLKEVAAKYGPETVGLWNHGSGGRFIYHILRAWGCINMVQPSYAQCRGSRDVGYELTFGTEVGSPEVTDIANTKCLVLIGSHLGENMHNMQVQDFSQAIENKATIIVVDPRYSVAASKAKYWLPIKPGTDMALILAWINVLISENLYDKAFVADNGYGFDKFVAEVTEYTPEWAESLTDIPAETIRDTAREMAAFRPATLVHPGRRTNWNGDDTQRSRANALLNALLGNWGRKGGFHLRNKMSLAQYPFPEFPPPGKPLVDNPDKKWPFARKPVTSGLRDATISGEPYPIKAWVVYACNVGMTMPNPPETRKAADNLDLLVVIDTHPSDTAGYADVVLPDTTYLERHDDFYMGSGKESWASIRQPVVDPPGDQKPAWWMAKQLAERLGVGEYMPFENMDEYLAKRCELSGLDYDQVRKDGIVMGPKQPITIEEGATISFPTPSKKVEFYSDQLAEAGFDPVPKYTPPDDVPEGHFFLITGRAPMHTFSRSQTNPLLQGLMDENELWVNTKTAATKNISNGDYVILKNQDGVISNRVRVMVTERIRPDTFYMVYGFGHRNMMLKSAALKGASASRLNTRYKTDPLMGATSIHTNFVTLEKEKES